MERMGEPKSLSVKNSHNLEVRHHPKAMEDEQVFVKLFVGY